MYHARFDECSFETINDLMTLQDQIDSFQKLIFAHFKMSGNNEVRISALVPLVKESYGIYRFITSMARALHRSESSCPSFVDTFQIASDRRTLSLTTFACGIV